MSTSALMNTYGSRSTKLVKGEGPYVWDDLGNRYLDAISGIAVCGLGHCHPAVTKAIQYQAETLIHCSNLYLIEPQQQLGEALINVSGMSKVFFSNSGAEANEAALKIARKYGNAQGIETPTVIATKNSFHGRTIATLSATGNTAIQAGFEPLLEGFAHVEYGDIAAIQAITDENVVAVMVEPIQGEGGVNIPYAEYLNDLRKLCDQRNWLLILDEIQTGNGRTGKYFAYQHNGILPDVVTTAKGLGNGVPIGACLAQGAASEVLQPGNHGSTFGGNPLAANAALAVVKELTETDVIENAASMGSFILEQFKEQLSTSDHVVDVRGKGMMIGIELDRECKSLVESAKAKGLLINVANANTIRLLPPLIINKAQASEIVATTVDIIHEFYAN
ncbi:MAG: aspartate aminotransferase family protein [Alteromonadaceae bacterium]|nr:MAG: aspartate aminotransferase family protein [Alteromonadaceae bacterium]